MAARVDYSALRTNQALIVLFLILSFLLDQRWLVGFVAAVMLVGTIWPQYSLFKLLYSSVLRPAGLIKADVHHEEPQPHLFAQALGAIFLLGAVAAFLLSAPLVAWSLSFAVAGLAFVNLFFDFCLGCFIFFQLGRVGLRPELPQWRGNG
ncbi:MAG: DUF4395 domain-containing protein [Litorilinea sp.]